MFVVLSINSAALSPKVPPIAAICPAFINPNPTAEAVPPEKIQIALPITILAIPPICAKDAVLSINPS